MCFLITKKKRMEVVYSNSLFIFCTVGDPNLNLYCAALGPTPQVMPPHLSAKPHQPIVCYPTLPALPAPCPQPRPPPRPFPMPPGCRLRFSQASLLLEDYQLRINWFHWEISRIKSALPSCMPWKCAFLTQQIIIL